MTSNLEQIKSGYEKSDSDWFNLMCEIFEKKHRPILNEVLQLLGTRKSNPNDEIRGSNFINPNDKRFDTIFISPIHTKTDNNLLIENIGFSGSKFSLPFKAITEKFKDYKTSYNTYDGGTQFFFYPVSEIYEFAALDFWTKKEMFEIKDYANLSFDNVIFRFGNSVTYGKDGYGIKP